MLTIQRSKSAEMKSPKAIATIPMLNSKMYVVWSPKLIHAVMRHKHMSMDNLIETFSQRIFGTSAETIERFKAGGGVHTIMSTAQKAALKGPHLADMNLKASGYYADALNDICKCKRTRKDDELHVPNVYLWLRRHGTMATAEALYGRTNPLRQDPSLIDTLWEFEENLHYLIPGFMPKLFARTAYRNRTKLQAAFAKYYGARMDHEKEVSGMIKVSAAEKRKLGLCTDELARLESGLLFAATTNTIPTLYWLFLNIWTRPDIIDAVRREVSGIVDVVSDSGGGLRKAMVDITRLETGCPLLTSCYRETIRLGSQVVGSRVVQEDTLVTDDDGTSYLLKRGIGVMWTARTLHRSPEVWENSDEFVPDRFMADATGSEKEEKERKQAYIPFGGGKHLCPGRNFAFTEILAFLSALALGFEVTGLRKGSIKPGGGRICDAIVKPPSMGEGVSITIQRREGWEDVEWSFIN